MTVATVIVNFRTAAATIEAVSALWPDLERLPDSLVVVVDNDSGDGSLEHLQAAFAEPKWGGRVKVVDGGYNRGFGGGVNAGIEHVRELGVRPAYFYVLNPDATVHPGTLDRLLRFMADHPRAGLLGNEVRNRGSDTVRAFRFPSFFSELEGSAHLGPLSRLLHDFVVAINPTESCEVDWVSGVSMLFRAEALAEAGVFDEGFFLYFEEIDLAKRIRVAGWQVFFVAGVIVDHVGGLSTGFKDEERRMPRYWFESRRRYLVKHHGLLYAAACDAARICGNTVFKAKVALSRRQHSVRPHFGRDFARFSVANFFKPAPEARPRPPSKVAGAARAE
jgi:GT2 family glycosyltransferase